MSSTFSEHESIAFRSRKLTDRELKCLQLAADGLSRKMIADEIKVAEGTVQNLWHVAALKLGADNSKHAIAMGFRRGILQ